MCQLAFLDLAGVVQDILIVPVSISYDKVRRGRCSCSVVHITQTVIPVPYGITNEIANACYIFLCCSCWREAMFATN